MPPARYANAPIIQISTAYHHIGGRAEIAAQLYLAEGTVKTYVTHLLNCLTLRNRSQLAIYANSISASASLKESPQC